MESNNRKSSPPKTNAGGQKNSKDRGRQFRLAIVIAGFLLALAVVLSPVLLLTVFRVRNVLIDGTVQYSNEQIVTASGIKKGANIVFLDSEEAEESIKKLLPYIETAKVTKKFPSTVVLTLVPAREAYALALQAENAYLVLDDSLKIIKKTADIPDGTVLIRAPQPVSDESGDMLAFIKPVEETTEAETQPAGGENAGGEDSAEEETSETTTEKDPEPPVDHTLNVLRLLIDTVLNESFSDVTVIDITDLSDLRLVYQNRLMLRLGTSSDLNKKLALARDVIKEENLKNPDQIGTINLSILKQASFKRDFFDGELPTQKQEEEAVTDEGGNVIDAEATTGDEEEYDPDSDEQYNSDDEEDSDGNNEEDSNEDYEEDYDEESCEDDEDSEE